MIIMAVSISFASLASSLNNLSPVANISTIGSFWRIKHARSKSCIVISLNIPPDTFKYAALGPLGSLLVIIICSNVPISPLSFFSFAER